MARSFNPWRFSSIAIPPELRRELIATELPRIPEERLYKNELHRGSSAAGVPWRLLVLGAFVVSSLVVASFWLWS